MGKHRAHELCISRHASDPDRSGSIKEEARDPLMLVRRPRFRARFDAGLIIRLIKVAERGNERRGDPLAE